MNTIQAAIAEIVAEALRDAADELARRGHRSAVTRRRERADRIAAGLTP